jgi:hypothetical protein
VKPGNSGLEKPGLSGLPGMSGIFPGVSGVHTENPKSQCCAFLLLFISHFHILPLVQIMRVKIRRETEEPSTQRRTKARHDPTALRAMQEALGQEGSQRISRPRRGDPPPSYAEGSDDEIEEEEEEEERTESDDDEVEDDTYEHPPEPLHRHGKGPAKEKTRYKPHPKKSHQYPYIQQSRATTRTPPKHKQGVAAHICPKTPPRLIPTLPPNVRVVNTPMNLREPGSVLSYAEHMYRYYSKNALAVREQREEDVYRYLKGEGLEARFWCDFHRDFYQTVIRNPKLVAKNMVPIVKMRYIDWKYYEDLNNTVFNSVIEKCKEVGLYDIMGFRYNWNKEILAQFHCSYYYNPYDNTITWTTQRNKCTIDYMTFSRLLGLGSKDEERTPIHNETKYNPRELTFMFPSRDLAIGGKADQLNPYYYYLNQFFCSTIDPKQGDATALRYFAPNLFNRMAPDEEGFCIFDFIWNELRRAMNDPMKYLPYAPYLMYMIERVTNVCYPKDVFHEPFRHLRDQAKKAPKARKYVGSSSTAPRRDDMPAAPSPPRPPRQHRGSMIKRVLKSIFSMCKTMATETNENRQDIIEIKSHLGLPTDSYRELPTFYDPFAEWDAQDEEEGQEEEEDNEEEEEEDDGNSE